MNPFYFASRERALFGVYHPPGRRRAHYRGAILCYPFGVEYMRAHRAFRQLANRLAGEGLHVLRFDYFGTGDSAGSAVQASLARWRADIVEAITELQETAGLDRVTLIGLRLGAALAMEVAQDRGDVEQLVAWDPVASGTAYLSDLVAGSHPGTGEMVGVQGFPLPPHLRAELSDIDLIAATPPPAAHLVLSREDAGSTRLRQNLEAHGRLDGARVVVEAREWLEADSFGRIHPPGPAVNTIVEVVREWGQA